MLEKLFQASVWMPPWGREGIGDTCMQTGAWRLSHGWLSGEQEGRYHKCQSYSQTQRSWTQGHSHPSSEAFKWHASMGTKHSLARGIWCTDTGRSCGNIGEQAMCIPPMKSPYNTGYKARSESHVGNLNVPAATLRKEHSGLERWLRA